MKFRFLTSGESHGKCLNAIIEGIPAGFGIETDFINSELSKRQTGYGRGGRMQIEKDCVEIKSGVRLGVTTGAPVCLEIKNKDWENWQVPMSVEQIDLSDKNAVLAIKEKKITKIRPGHADLAGALKYNHNDIRDILERSSARETAARVAVGAIAKLILMQFGIFSFSHVVQIGGVYANETPDNPAEIEEKAEKSDLRCADENACELMKREIDETAARGDTLGGTFEVVFKNIPVGLGSFVHWDKRIDGLIAQAVMSIPAVKSVEIGAGKSCAALSGSDFHDEIYYNNGKYTRGSNNAGGIEGGMTNGENLVVRACMKPIPTMKMPLNSVDMNTKEAHKAHFERSDVCAVPACAVVAESMTAIVLVDEFLNKFGGDSLPEIKSNYSNYLNMISR